MLDNKGIYRIVSPSLVLMTCLFGVAEANPYGIKGQQAPSWGITEWIQLPGSRRVIDVENFRGKVLYLYCFQTWCPGCHLSGFPTLETLINQYRNDDKIAFVAIQTVFEGYKSNTPERGFDCARRYDLNIPFGHSGSSEKQSAFVNRYRMGGTPWVVIIDGKGKIHHNSFQIKAKQASLIIDSLKKKLQKRKREDGPNGSRIIGD